MENYHSSQQSKMLRLIRLFHTYQSIHYKYGQEVVKTRLIQNFTLSLVDNLELRKPNAAPVVTLCRVYEE